MTRTRIPSWKIALGLIGGLLALGLGTGLWIECRAKSRWSEMQKTLEEVEAELRSRDPARPPLRGNPVPGNAWMDYGRAFPLIMAALGSEDALHDYSCRSPKGDRAVAERLVSQFSPVLDHLGDGARRSEAAFPDGWETRNRGVAYPAAMWVGWLAVTRARLLHESGSPRQASELLLDTCQYGRDLWFNGSDAWKWIGLGIIGLSLDEIKRLIDSRSLVPDDCASVARGLEVLDCQLPGSGPSILKETCAWTRMLRSGADEGRTLTKAPRISLWRYGFTQRLVIADAFRIALFEARARETADSLPWDRVRTEEARILSRRDSSRNPLLDGSPAFLNDEMSVRGCIVRLRLLRIAATYRASGELPDLPDPFGARLRSEVAADRLKVWSVGPDGADDGGVGAWKAAPDGPAPKDLVLEAGR